MYVRSAYFSTHLNVCPFYQSCHAYRSELFICGSVNTGSCSSYDSCYRATTDGCTTNLNDLDLDYVDMIMLDYPSRAGCDAILGQWMAFEDMLKAGGTKALVRQQDTKSLM